MDFAVGDRVYIIAEGVYWWMITEIVDGIATLERRDERTDRHVQDIRALTDLVKAKLASPTHD